MRLHWLCAAPNDEDNVCAQWLIQRLTVLSSCLLARLGMEAEAVRVVVNECRIAFNRHARRRAVCACVCVLSAM